ncbi:MAG: HAD family phosphatase [Erysipelotrichaceae bacterium]|nr:HAD family phosphatase [Erysipelotrichaceae bacterium]
MIKDIVFDLGNVIITFEPDKFLDQLLKDPGAKAAVMDVYFPELWDEYDRGDHTIEEMIEIGAKRYPQYEPAFRSMMLEWVNHLVPLRPSFDLIRELKEKGYRIFLLSNLSEQGYRSLQEEEELLSYLDGGIYSYQYHLKKPDPRIYRILMDTYDIDPKTSLFIDDRIENVETARRLGFETIHCSDYDRMPQWVREKLYEVSV